MSRSVQRTILAQLAHPLGDRNPSFCNRENIPLAGGYLRAATRARGGLSAEDISILDPILAEHAGDAYLINVLVERRPDVLALSLYPWNLVRSVRLARELHARLPGLTVVAGGPEVNEVSLPLLFDRGAVDFAVPGEGEVTFPDLLAALADGRDPATVAGLALRRNGAIVHTPPRPTLSDLDQIPSPYLEGDIDPNAWRQAHVILERGCAHACKYCHWWPDSRSKGAFSIKRLEEELELLHSSAVEEVIFLDAALNASPRFDEICTVLQRVNADGKLNINAQILFDRLDRTQAEKLAAAGIRRIELGLQTADAEVLMNNNRPLEVDRFMEAVRALDGLPISPQIDLFTGLPGDTPGSIIATAGWIRKNLIPHLFAQKKAANLMMFILSVGSPTQLRHEAEALGLRFQPEPPYRVLSTANLDFKAIRSMRMEFSWLLGLAKHPLDEFDRPHYSVNLFHPELASWSAPTPGRNVAKGDSASGSSDCLIDAVRIDCRGTASGPGHPFSAKALASRLAQVVQVWFRVDDPSSCRQHMSQTLETLSSPNRHGIWDLVLETDREFDPDLVDQLLAAVRTEVSVVDWDCYFINPEEGPGHARVSVRPFIIVPLGAVSPRWLEIVAPRFPVVHAVTVGPDNLEEVLDRVSRLPGEGMLAEVARDAGYCSGSAPAGRDALTGQACAGFPQRGPPDTVRQGTAAQAVHEQHAQSADPVPRPDRIPGGTGREYRGAEDHSGTGAPGRRQPGQGHRYSAGHKSSPDMRIGGI